MKEGKTMYTDTYKVELAIGQQAGWQLIWWESVDLKISLPAMKSKNPKKIKIPLKFHAAIKDKGKLWKLDRDRACDEKEPDSDA